MAPGLTACADKGDGTLPGDDSATVTDTASTDVGDIRSLGARNLIVVHADTLRRDHLQAYGYDRDTMPGMATRDWKRIDGAYGTTSWTVPSTASALTGLIPEHHGAVRVDEASAIAEPFTAGGLPSVLGAEGFATGFFSSNSILDEGGFETGWDTAFFQDDYETVYLSGIAQKATDWLETVPADQRFFVWLQPMDAHLPYGELPAFRGTWSSGDALAQALEGDDAERAFAEAWMAATESERPALQQTLFDLYDEQILSLDAGLTELLTSLEASGRLDDTLVVFTADHGETLGDGADGQVGHGGNVRDELVALPLLMWHPRLDPTPEACLSSNTSLMPTVLAGLGVAAPEGLDGGVVPEECQDHVLFDVYANKTAEPGLDALGATNGRYAVNYDCYRTRYAGYDLESDPAMLLPLPIYGNADLEALATPLDAYLADIVAQYPTVSCSPTQ